MSFAIAIDGPAGAGKSTIARLAAQKLGALYVDTGAMYRSIALGLQRLGTDLEDPAARKKALSSIRVTLSYENGEQQVWLNEENVSGLIRTEQISALASKAAGYADVRSKLTSLQRELAAREDVIMDGRDIGTVILPDAPLKIYLTASVSERARRRAAQMQEKGIPCSLEEIEKDIRERDWQDMHRKEAPLRQAEDAVFLDTSDMGQEEVTDTIVRLAEQKREQLKAEQSGKKKDL